MSLGVVGVCVLGEAENDLSSDGCNDNMPSKGRARSSVVSPRASETVVSSHTRFSAGVLLPDEKSLSDASVMTQPSSSTSDADADCDTEPLLDAGPSCGNSRSARWSSDGLLLLVVVVEVVVMPSACLGKVQVGPGLGLWTSSAPLCSPMGVARPLRSSLQLLLSARKLSSWGAGMVDLPCFSFSFSLGLFALLR